MICERTLADAIRPKLSQSARERVEEIIEAWAGGDLEDSQVASDLQFLLDHHDRVHAAWEIAND